MLRRSGEKATAVKEQMFGGESSVRMWHLLNGSEEMRGKGRLLAHTCEA